MWFWNAAYNFEKHGDRYVYRPTVFSTGFDISKSEKDNLIRELNRLEWRFLLEGAALIALIAALFMTGVIKTPTPIPWFMFVSVVAVAALAVTAFLRRDWLVLRILGHRTPDVPRLPFRKALAKPRLPVSKRFAIPVLHSVIVLLALAIAAGDALVLYVIVAAHRFQQSAERPEETVAIAELLSLASSSVVFWLVVGLFNAVLLASILLLIREVRRLRAAETD